MQVSPIWTNCRVQGSPIGQQLQDPRVGRTCEALCSYTEDRSRWRAGLGMYVLLPNLHPYLELLLLPWLVMRDILFSGMWTDSACLQKPRKMCHGPRVSMCSSFAKFAKTRTQGSYEPLTNEAQKETEVIQSLSLSLHLETVAPKTH